MIPSRIVNRPETSPDGQLVVVGQFLVNALITTLPHWRIFQLQRFRFWPLATFKLVDGRALMSCDLGVWYPQERIANKEARELYARLCDSDTSGVVPHPAIDEFYTELIARYPEIDTIPEEKIDDHDHCPWSCKLDYSPGHVVMSCVWSKANDVHQLVENLGRKHGLAIYDPQSDVITYPDGSTGAGKETSRAALWILGSFALLFAAIFVYSEQIAPSSAPLVLYVFAGLCGLMAVACFRQALR